MGRSTQFVVIGLAAAIAIGGAVACSSQSTSRHRTSSTSSDSTSPSAQIVIPTGGAPNVSYRVEVPCSTKPEVRVRDLQSDAPQATLISQPGTETRPGWWSYAISAGDVDQKVSAKCPSSLDESHRYDVDEPKLFPGPTYDSFGGWRPRSVIEVIGTDCPTGTEASVSLSGKGGYRKKVQAAIDKYGNWLVLIPDGAPAGDISATATCGDVTYDRLLITANERP